jgi:hypothetical protein
MEIIARRPAVVFFMLLALAWFAYPAGIEPFPIGNSMATLGTILQQTGVSGRGPFSPACFYADTFRYGVSVAGAEYFDPMDNMQATKIYRAGAGGFFSLRGFTAKLSYTHFDAMRVYFEQEGCLSFGIGLIPFVNPSIELSGFRAGLYRPDESVRSRIDMGISAMVPFRIAAVSVSCGHIPLRAATVEGFDAPFVVRAGVHTASNALGSQGILCEGQNNGQWRFRVALGEEYRVFDKLSLAAAFITNPVMISFGVTLAWKAAAISAAFVEHPVLGWSKGLAVDWAGR